MSRIKRGTTTHAKHKRLLNAVKGYRGQKSKLVRIAHEAFLHAGQYAYEGRKNKKRDFRRSFILTISEALKKQGVSYSNFMFALKNLKIEIDRKILAELIKTDLPSFTALVEKSKSFKVSK